MVFSCYLNMAQLIFLVLVVLRVVVVARVSREDAFDTSARGKKNIFYVCVEEKSKT